MQTLGLIQVINEMSNLFVGDGSELLALNTRYVIEESVANTVHTIEEVGKAQYDSYSKAIITEPTKSIRDPIKRNTLPLFISPSKRKSKQSEDVSLLKEDVSLFSHLYIVAQNRDTDMGTFFQPENHLHPPFSVGKRKTVPRKEVRPHWYPCERPTKLSEGTPAISGCKNSRRCCCGASASSY